MNDDTRWRDGIDFEFNTVWGERREERERRHREEVALEIEMERPLRALEQLRMGQSLILHWSDDLTTMEFEAAILCPLCGEALTEFRLALVDLSLLSCPSCGHPPSA